MTAPRTVPSPRPVARLLVALAAFGLLAVGCGGSDDDADAARDDVEASESTVDETDDDASGSTDDETDDDALRILVTNDDGVGAEGIDAVVEALADAGHEVEVVAPLEQQSGTGGTFTDGPVETEDAETASGHPALAVDGFPADTVRVALDEEGIEVDLVVSGINEGQNVGALVDVSGTIGAARAAVARDVPALALSAGLGPFEAGYEVGVDLMLDWIDENLDVLLAGEAEVQVTSINIPSCTDGEVRGPVDVPVATEGDFLEAQDCTSPLEDPADDTEALNNGWAAISVVPDEPDNPPEPG